MSEERPIEEDDRNDDRNDRSELGDRFTSGDLRLQEVTLQQRIDQQTRAIHILEAWLKRIEGKAVQAGSPTPEQLRLRIEELQKIKIDLEEQLKTQERQRNEQREKEERKQQEKQWIEKEVQEQQEKERQETKRLPEYQKWLEANPEPPEQTREYDEWVEERDKALQHAKEAQKQKEQREIEIREREQREEKQRKREEQERLEKEKREIEAREQERQEQERLRREEREPAAPFIPLLTSSIPSDDPQGSAIELQEIKQSETIARSTTPVYLFKKLAAVLNGPPDSPKEEEKKENKYLLSPPTLPKNNERGTEGSSPSVFIDLYNDRGEPESHPISPPSIATNPVEESEHWQAVIAQDDGVRLAQHLDRVPANAVNLKDYLTYAVQQYKPQAVACLLSRLLAKKEKLSGKELDELLTICMKEAIVPKSNSSASAIATLKSLFSALPDIAKNPSTAIDELIQIFAESEHFRSHPSVRDRYVLWLFKIKSGIPLDVSTNNNLPVLWMMKSFAEAIDIEGVRNNLSNIELLAKSAVLGREARDGQIKPGNPNTAREINIALDLAIALDNSATGSQTPQAFSALLKGMIGGAQSLISQSPGCSEYVSDLLLERFPALPEAPLLNKAMNNLKEMIRKELLAELSNYLETENKQKHLNNIKILTEIIIAIRDQRYEQAKLLARKLPNNSDSRVWFKRGVSSILPLLMATNIAVLFFPSSEVLRNAFFTDAHSGAIYAAIIVLLPFILKWNKFLADNERFADKLSIRAGIQELTPKSFWRTLAGMDSSASESPANSRNLARGIAETLPAPDQHPLASLEATFAAFSEIKKSDQTWQSRFIDAVRDNKRGAAQEKLRLAISSGVELGVKSHTSYPSSDPLVHAFHLCLKNPPKFSMFKDLLREISDERKFGKFTFDLLTLVLTHSDLSESQKGHFMYTLVRSKYQLSLPLKTEVSGHANLDAILQLMESGNHHKSTRASRILAMMSKLAMQGLNQAEKPGDSKDGPTPQQKVWLTDISEALGRASTLKEGPVSPHGYVDPFSAILVGLFSKMEPDPLLPTQKEQGIATAIQFMTFTLQGKIDDLRRQADELKGATSREEQIKRKQLSKELKNLEDNMQLIKERMTIRLEELLFSAPDKSRSWETLNYEHLKNLVHYTHALCRDNPNPTPVEIWRASAEPQEVKSTLKLSLKSAPALFALCGSLISARDTLGIPVPTEAAIPALLTVMFLQALTEIYARLKEQAGAFLPNPVKAYANTDVSLVEHAVGSFKSKQVS